MTYFRTHLMRFLVPLALAAVGAVLCGLLMPGETEAVRQQLIGFPDSDVAAHQARPWVLAGLCFLPAVASLFYAFGGTLDRYIAREFLSTFLLCLTALSMIWLLMDLADKIGDFRESKHILRTVGTFYATRSPAVLLLLLPYSLLLALLYSLGKFSGNREIISMIQGGRGVVRITLPLIVAGLFFSLLSAGLNYQWAPTAEGNVDEILDEATGKTISKANDPVLYRNPRDRRLWKIGIFPPNYEKGEALLDLEVTTTRPDNTLESRLTSKRATWDLDRQRWTFEQPVISSYQPGQPPVFQTLAEPLVADWSETPWQLIKPGLSAEFLGVPDLNTWIRENARRGEFADPAPYLTQWHHRWALPLTCMVTVLLATPLAIHFSRRGAGGGVFMAVVLSALMLLVTSISMALGEAGSLQPPHAAWFPNIAFALIGLYLFRRRITGKPIYLVLRKLIPGSD
jgi:LPS export ABC transporter permease LptG